MTHKSEVDWFKFFKSVTRYSPVSCFEHRMSYRVKEYMMNKRPAVYLLTNRPNGTLYTGVTSDLPKRVWQHKNEISKGFCTKYNLNKLVYFELFEDMYQAISREKQIKAGSRKAKIKLIESINPVWKDLYQSILY